MTSPREKALGNVHTHPDAPEPEVSTEDTNTAVRAPMSDTQPTAPIAKEAPRAPAPRLKTAPYVIFDALAAKQEEEETTRRRAVEIRREHLRTSPEVDEPAIPQTGTTIPGPGPSGPGPAPVAIVPVAAPTSADVTTRTRDARPPPPSFEDGPKRIVSVTGAFVGGILAIAVVAGAGVFAFIARDRIWPRPQQPEAVPSDVAPKTNKKATAVGDESAPPKPSTSPAPTTSASPAPAPSASAPPEENKPLAKESGARPSKASLDRMTTALKPLLSACVKGQPKAMYSVKITFDGATGKPTDALTYVPIRGTVAGGCVLGAAFGARINPFSGGSFTDDVKFSP